MPFTIRLDPRVERMLNGLARRKRVSRAHVVREAIARYEAEEGGPPGSPTPYSAWSDVIGLVEFGARNAAQSTGEQFAGVLRDRQRARRPR